MIRLLHTGDLHPNASGTFAGKTVTDPETGLNQSLIDLRKSLAFVAQVATAPGTRCDAAVLPGDLFDSPRPHMDEVRIIKEFAMALASEMPVICCPGNHDLSQNTSSASALACLTGIPNVYIRETPDSIVLDLNGQTVRFSFLPYPTKGRLLAHAGTAELSPEAVTAMINQGLADILRRPHPQATNQPHVLLAHGSVSASVMVGEQPRSLAHDIQIPLDELGAFDFIALSHIHQHQQVAPNAWYCGSLMRQSFGEEKEAKGFNLVSLDAMEADGPHVVFVENPHARDYRTIPVSELEDDLVLDADTVWRVTGPLSAEHYEMAKPLLDQLQSRTPYFQQDIELVTEDRARDAGMASMLTMEAAIRRVLPEMPEPELMEILGKHARLEQEVGR